MLASKNIGLVVYAGQKLFNSGKIILQCILVFNRYTVKVMGWAVFTAFKINNSRGTHSIVRLHQLLIFMKLNLNCFLLQQH
jgi:ABC-type transport system involved in Fe-S cluster assembly fused permease/ATPase subunit